MSGQALETLPVQFKMLKESTDQMAKLLMQVRLFPPGHPSIALFLDKVYTSIRALMTDDTGISLKLVKNSLCLLNFEYDLQGSSDRNVHVLLSSLKRLSIGEIEFRPDLEKNELLAFMEIAASAVKGDKSFDFNSAWAKIRNINIRHESLDACRSEPENGIRHDRQMIPLESESTSKLSAESVIGQEVGNVLEKLEKIQSMEGRAARKMILGLVENEVANNTLILFLKSLRAYDDYTFAHSVNVSVISMAQARHIGWDEAQIGKIGLAAIMHDIGKIYVPRRIIKKTEKLTPSEWQAIKRHPVDGARLLKEEGVEEDICRVAYEHHMRYDLSGYPALENGMEVLEGSQIVRIADTYDALTTKRAYRRQISPYEAIKLMARTRGTEFHPGYFDMFLHMMGNIPIGSTLELKSGEKVLVVDINTDKGALPIVRVLSDADGQPVSEKIILDLNNPGAGAEGKGQYMIKSVENEPVRDVEVGKYLVPKV
ncbi:MAG: HD-GYP domain-containing protein [Candidatus Krumholzibacteria bacterium]|nr:HD-GYP domain-containing protein [Candidatus Krumholzibacteria bacterium]